MVSDVHILIGDVVVSVENSDALLYLKLWYCFYIRVEYQRLHENNLARRRQLMCKTGLIHFGIKKGAVAPFFLQRGAMAPFLRSSYPLL